jgi:hypothetical protein
MPAWVLDAPPISGAVEEQAFHLAGEPVWVLFDLENGTSWVGVFGSDRARLDRPVGVATLDAPPVAYVVTGRRDYLVDYQTRQLVCLVDADSLSEGVIAIESPRSFVVWNNTWLRSIDPHGRLLWVSEHVAWDGLRDVHQEGEIVTGEAWSPIDNNWIPFGLDPASGWHWGGSY